MQPCLYVIVAYTCDTCICIIYTTCIYMYMCVYSVSTCLYTCSVCIWVYACMGIYTVD